MALPDDKFHKKQSQLIERTSAALNISTSEAEQLLTIPRQQSLRVNTLHADAATSPARGFFFAPSGRRTGRFPGHGLTA